MFDRNMMGLPGMRAVMAALAVLALLQAAAIAGQATSLSWAISRLWEGTAVADVVSAIAAFAVCFVVLQLARFAQDTVLDRYSLRQADRLHRLILDSTFDERVMLSQTESAAVVATSAADGIDEAQTYIRIIPPKIIGMALVSLPLLAVEFAIDWPSGVILAVMFPVIVFFMVLLGRQSRERAERQYVAYTLLSNRFMDTLRGLDVLKSFDASKREERSVYSYSERLRRATVRTLATATLSSAVLDLCATLGIAAVAMMLAFRLMDGSVELATGLAALMLAPEYFAPIRSFASDFHASLDGKNALSAILGMLDRAARKRDAATAGDSAEQQPISWTQSSTLAFEGVSYRYDDGAHGVHGLSFTLHGHEKVAIVGESGAGKSTLAKLVAGFLEPAEGTVLLNAERVDLASRQWKERVRIIPQHPYVFQATLADNIRFYCPDATLDEVDAAARAVGLASLVDELPDGLNTLVGEGARGLSGGQAHRVALARILLDDKADVLVFDEPTAHLDIETELELKQSMLPLMEGRLVLFATHRLHWIEDMDRVIVLEHGSIAREEART